MANQSTINRYTCDCSEEEGCKKIHSAEERTKNIWCKRGVNKVTSSRSQVTAELINTVDTTRRPELHTYLNVDNFK